MAENEDWFVDVQAALDDTAVEVLEEESAPGLQSAPSAEAQPPVSDASPGSEPGAEPATPIVETAPVPESPSLNWDSPENPHYAATQKLAAITKLQEMYQAQQAEKLRKQQLEELADGDPTQAMKLQQFVEHERQPLVQRLNVTENELEMAAKLATVTDEAVRLVVPPEYQDRVYAEVRRMMSIPGGPAILQSDIQTRTQIKTEYETKIQQMQAQIAELQRGTEAKNELDQRIATGADHVGAGTGGTGSLESRWDAASNFDEAFDVIMQGIGLRPT